MPMPPAYNPVYNLHVRLLPEPSLHANPLIQTPPVLHWEGLHTIQWLLSDPKRRSSTVLGDCLRFALEDHDSGKLIPHVPWPLMAGPFLLDTLHGSKYQIVFHQPNVLLDERPVGVFQWLIAPPWRCIEVKLPLPRFMARAGRRAAARGASKRSEEARKKLSQQQEALELAEQRWADVSSLRQGMKLVQEAAPLREAWRGAEDELNEAQNQEERRAAHERHGRLLDEEAEALQRKRESDRLRRGALALAARRDEEALAIAERGVQGPRMERSAALTMAAEQRARAAAIREGAQAWAKEAREQEAIADARREAARKQRATLRRADEALARARGKKENPIQQATGASNAGVSAPSVLAHLPFPATVEIQVSWSQIRKTWLNALVAAAADALKYYVGFVVDGVLVPGRGKAAAVLLDVVKSGINDTVIDSAAKFLTGGTWQIKLSARLGPVKVGVHCEPDPARGGYRWQSTLEPTEKGSLLLAPKPKLSIEGHDFSVPEKATLEVAGVSAEASFITQPTADYAHAVPALS